MASECSLKDLKLAVKRARHFTKQAGLPFISSMGPQRDLTGAAGGPFTPTGRTGLSIPVRNVLWLLDLGNTDEYKEQFEPHMLFEETWGGDLRLIIWLATMINRYIDGHLIEGNVEDTWALLAFLARYHILGVDISKLDLD